MDIFPIKGDSLPISDTGAAYAGWLILLDEFNSATLATQAAAYKVVLDKKVGQFDLHPNTVIMCAGNKNTDNAIVSRMSTAMQSRLIHLELAISHVDWITWAHNNKVDHRVISFIEFKPKLLHDFSPDHHDHTFPCPRTWEFLSNIIKNKKEVDFSYISVIEGTVGKGAAAEFVAFCSVYAKLPTLPNILQNPSLYLNNLEPSVLYAVTGMFASYINTDNIAQCMEAITYLPSEFQVIAIRGSLITCPELKQNPAYVKWKHTTVDFLR